MIDRLYCQTLQEFFSNINWQGKPTETEIVDRSYDSPADVRSLTVGEFFSRVNWHGRALTITAQQQTKTAFSVTLSVTELFSLFIWENKPEIAVLPQLKPSLSTNTNSVYADVNLKNLTDLF
jgi:hypothetical protein